MRTAVLLVAGAALCTPEDIAVLWDVSRSCPPALYSPLVHQTVAGLIEGRGVPQGWQVTLPDGAPEVTAVISGQRPPVRPNERVLIVRFGSIAPDNIRWYLPFPVVELSYQGPQQHQYPFPDHRTDDWTNKLLAEAGAAYHFNQAGRQRFFILLISDLNQNNLAPLTHQQTTLVDQYLAGRLVAVSPAAVLRLESEPRVIIALRYAIAATRPQAPAGGVVPSQQPLITLIAPRNNSRLDGDRPVAFSWRWHGAEPPGRYRLVVTTSGPRPRVVISETTPVAGLTTRRPLAAGKYVWRVFSTFGERTIQSDQWSFEIRGTNILPFILLCLLLVGAFVFWLNRRQTRRRTREV